MNGAKGPLHYLANNLTRDKDVNNINSGNTLVELCAIQVLKQVSRAAYPGWEAGIEQLLDSNTIFFTWDFCLQILWSSVNTNDLALAALLHARVDNAYAMPATDVLMHQGLYLTDDDPIKLLTEPARFLRAIALSRVSSFYSIDLQDPLDIDETSGLWLHRIILHNPDITQFGVVPVNPSFGHSISRILRYAALRNVTNMGICNSGFVLSVTEMDNGCLASMTNLQYLYADVEAPQPISALSALVQRIMAECPLRGALVLYAARNTNPRVACRPCIARLRREWNEALFRRRRFMHPDMLQR